MWPASTSALISLSPSLLLSLCSSAHSLATHSLFSVNWSQSVVEPSPDHREIKEGTAKVCDYYRTNRYINLIGTRVVAFCSSHFKWSAWQTAGPGEGLAADKWEDQSEKKRVRKRDGKNYFGRYAVCPNVKSLYGINNCFLSLFFFFLFSCLGCWEFKIFVLLWESYFFLLTTITGVLYKSLFVSFYFCFYRMLWDQQTRGSVREVRTLICL